MNLCNSLFISPIKPLNPTPTTRSNSLKCSADSPTHQPKLADSLQQDTLITLEWPSICNQVSAFTSTTMGTSAARNGRVVIGRSVEESRRLLDQTSAAFHLNMPPDFDGIDDVSGLVECSVSGRLLSIPEICAVKRMLRSARSLFQQLKKIEEESERLQTFGPPLLLQMSADVVRRLQTFSCRKNKQHLRGYDSVSI